MPISKIVSDSLTAGVGGKVLQVKSTVKADVQSIAGMTFADVMSVSITPTSTSSTTTGLSAAITPASTSSKIVVIASMSGRLYTETNSDKYYKISVYRDSSKVYEKVTDAIQGALGAGGVLTNPPMDIHYTDAPSSTSSITYSIYSRVDNTGSNTKVQYINTCFLTLLEVSS